MRWFHSHGGPSSPTPLKVMGSKGASPPLQVQGGALVLPNADQIPGLRVKMPVLQAVGLCEAEKSSIAARADGTEPASPVYERL